MFALLSLMMLSITSVDAQCNGDFPNFVEFGAEAGDTTLAFDEAAFLLRPSIPITVFGANVNGIMVSNFELSPQLNSDLQETSDDVLLYT